MDHDDFGSPRPLRGLRADRRCRWCAPPQRQHRHRGRAPLPPRHPRAKPGSRGVGWCDPSWPNLLVVLGNPAGEGGDVNLYIGRESVLARLRITTANLRVLDAPPPIVLLYRARDRNAGRRVRDAARDADRQGRRGRSFATLSKITGPHGAAATAHLLEAMHELAGTHASVGDAVVAARCSLVAQRSPLGLVLAPSMARRTCTGGTPDVAIDMFAAHGDAGGRMHPATRTGS